MEDRGSLGSISVVGDSAADRRREVGKVRGVAIAGEPIRNVPGIEMKTRPGKHP